MIGPCRTCHRLDCALLADVIVGVQNWIAAYFDCQRARPAPQPITVARDGRRR